jgi:hypothetical protein
MVLFDMQNRTPGPYSAAISRLRHFSNVCHFLISVMCVTLFTISRCLVLTVSPCPVSMILHGEWV